MKKIYLTGISLMAVAMTFAQVREQSILSAETKVRPINVPMSNERGTKDTLYYSDLLDNGGGWTPTIYGSQNGGYVIGLNGYGDQAKAQEFRPGDLHPGSAHKVEGAGFWLDVKPTSSGNPNSVVSVRLYNMNGPGTMVAGNVNVAPNNTPLAQVNLSFATIAAAVTNQSLVFVSFPTPVVVGANQSYAIGLQLSTLIAGDTVGIVSSANGEFNFTEVVWEKWSNTDGGGWYTLSGAGWGSGNFEVGAGVLAAVDYALSIEEIGNLSSINAYPNPATDYTVISYSVNQNTPVTITVTDITGKLVATHNVQMANVGYGLYTLTTDNIGAGTYFYTVTTNNSSKTDKFIVVR